MNDSDSVQQGLQNIAEINNRIEYKYGLQNLQDKLTPEEFAKVWVEELLAYIKETS